MYRVSSAVIKGSSEDPDYYTMAPHDTGTHWLYFDLGVNMQLDTLVARCGVQEVASRSREWCPTSLVWPHTRTGTTSQPLECLLTDPMMGKGSRGWNS